MRNSLQDLLRPAKHAGRHGLTLLLAFLGSVPLLPAATPPVTTVDSPLGRQLNTWFRNGTAAGNVGDWYDNRDRGHSRFPTEHYPQISTLTYPPNALTQRLDWGACRIVRSNLVVVGNSSTASGATLGGSNTRLLYSHPSGLEALHGQYRANNLHIYPEHQDHDPGRHGNPGWGDLLPANTPYLLTSQGSSVTDQPLLHAVFATLAAFHPDTKRTLIHHGLLMPTVQMILRLNTTTVAGDTNRYLSGIAHPSAFPGATLNTTAMVDMAHRIQPDTLPPLAQIQVVSEEPAPPARSAATHFPNERLGDTPGAIARLWHSPTRTRRMVLSADASFDAHQRPLSFHWTLLRGDPSQVTVTPRNDSGSVVEVTFTWTGRRPVQPDSDLESNRIDLGLFVSNGTWWSAPAFVTCLTNDRELRSWHPDGRPLDISHLGATVSVEPGPLTPLLDWLLAASPTPAARAFRQLIQGPTLDRLLAEEPSLRVAEEPLMLARTELESARQALADLRATPPPSPERLIDTATRRVTRAQGALATAETAAQLATRAITEALRLQLSNHLHQPSLPASLVSLLPELHDTIPPDRLARLQTAAERLVAFGLTSGPTRWTFLPPPPRTTPTATERQLLTEFHAALVNEALPTPGWSATVTPHFAPSHLFPTSTWRDVFQYDAAGRLLGWRRFGDGPPRDYSADGLLVTARDPLGRPSHGSSRNYRIQNGILVEQDGPRRYTYSFTGPNDLRGRPQPIPATPQTP